MEFKSFKKVAKQHNFQKLKPRPLIINILVYLVTEQVEYYLFDNLVNGYLSKSTMAEFVKVKLAEKMLSLIHLERFLSDVHCYIIFLQQVWNSGKFLLG